MLGRVAGWAGPEACLSHEAAKPWVGCWLLGSQVYAVGCAWNFGWAGWAALCLGGSLDGQSLSHTHLGLRVAGWAGPEASRRHVRHASRRAEGLGLRLVSGWHTLRPVSDCAEGVGRGLGEGKSEDSLWRRDLSTLGPFEFNLL